MMKKKLNAYFYVSISTKVKTILCRSYASDHILDLRAIKIIKKLLYHQSKKVIHFRIFTIKKPPNEIQRFVKLKFTWRKPFSYVKTLKLLLKLLGFRYFYHAVDSNMRPVNRLCSSCSRKNQIDRL